MLAALTNTTTTGFLLSTSCSKPQWLEPQRRLTSQLSPGSGTIEDPSVTSPAHTHTPGGAPGPTHQDAKREGRAKPSQAEGRKGKGSRGSKNPFRNTGMTGHAPRIPPRTWRPGGRFAPIKCTDQNCGPFRFLQIRKVPTRPGDSPIGPNPGIRRNFARSSNKNLTPSRVAKIHQTTSQHVNI